MEMSKKTESIRVSELNDYVLNSPHQHVGVEDPHSHQRLAIANFAVQVSSTTNNLRLFPPYLTGIFSLVVTTRRRYGGSCIHNNKSVTWCRVTSSRRFNSHGMVEENRGEAALLRAPHVVLEMTSEEPTVMEDGHSVKKARIE
ncbi:hypothetical protein Rs2_22970 [Raphanus sativus]|nr:hypothetical protein Rs2_22970 [Raphanus sativus]